MQVGTVDSIYKAPHVATIGRDATDGDAALIRAAPNLLAALRELELCTRQFIAGDLVTFPAALLPACRGIIARAEGVQP
jgi:hypothetical protein